MRALRHHPAGSDVGSLSRAIATVDPGARSIAEERLSGRARRLTLTGGRRSSLVVKRVDRAAARKAEVVSSRWLPSVGLRDCGPPLLASVPAPGESVWQVLEDLSDCALDADRPAPRDLRVATRLLARVHVAFAGHGLLREWIDEFGSLGDFYANWVRRAASALEGIKTSGLSAGRLALRERLRRRVDALLREEAARTRRLQGAAWPVTLLHGDPWPQNFLLPPSQDGHRARLIDWDQAVVGPTVYDLSTFVSRFSPRARMPVLRLYEQAVRPAGWRLPDPAELNDAFETAELARLASCLISPAEAAAGGAGWAFEELGEVDGWFAALRPVLGARR